ncbi:MAG: hypothetical protein A2Z72_01680 [Omnitrophica bacterium RBG_13_46_9]|nr:MAG: hypothetical protein A2Z72_01680 [Omnitrophica bacterium RBG_13_46_9]
MGSLSKKILAGFTAIVFILNVTGCATPYMVHPEFKERHKNIVSASVMPPEVDAYILTFQGDKKRLHDIIPLMESTTVSEMKKALADKGYIVKELDLSEEALGKNPELRTSLFNVRKVFTKTLEDISKRKQKKFTYSIGSEVNVFADLADCDILIFIKEEGVKKSAGEVAKDVAKGLAISAACILFGVVYVPIPKTAAVLMHIAIVDSNDGAILWYTNNLCNPNWDPENQKHMTMLIKYLFKPFPQAAVKKSYEEQFKVIKEEKEIAPRERGTVIMPANPSTP